MEVGLTMLVRLVPVAILAWVVVGGAVGLIVDLPVLFRVCALVAIAALPLLLPHPMARIRFATRGAS